MGERVTFAGLSALRSTLARLTEALAEVAGGAVVELAAKDIAARVRTIAERRFAAAAVSGYAKSHLVVRIDGPRVLLDAPGYARLHSWNPFRRGMPASVVKFAASVMAAKYMEIIGDGQGSARALAEGIVSADEEKAGAKASEAFKRETAKQARKEYRESAAGKAARKAEAAKRRAAKKGAK